MASERLASIYHYLCKVAGREVASGLTDGMLVDRFVAQRDEAAFEVLLWRHGGMVLNVCRRILHNQEDVEDAFQATFLTFIRKARAISRRQAVAGWLYKVAFRVALAAKTRQSKVPVGGQRNVSDLADPITPSAWDDVGPILDEEMRRLPARYRLPIVLCYLEGKTNEEAARELGCPPGTIFSRLARGRELLRSRLTRRGVTIPAALLTAFLTTDAATASLTTPLVQATLKTAMMFVAGQAALGVSAKAIALAEGVLKAMFMTKIKATVAAAMVCGLLIAGASGYLGPMAAESQEPSAKTPHDQDPPAPREAQDRTSEGAILVQVIKPAPGGLERVTTQAATVEPFEMVDITSRVGGILKNQKVDIGDRVKQGQLLAEIDAPTLAKDEEQAITALESARSQLRIGEAAIAAAEAEVKASKQRVVNAHAEYLAAHAHLMAQDKKLKRVKQLESERAVSEEIVAEGRDRVDAAKYRMEIARGTEETAETEVRTKLAFLDKAKAELLSRSIAIRGAQAALEKARIMIGLTRITAPFDGIVTKRNFNNGDFIRSVDQGNQQSLLTVIRDDRMRVVVQVPREAVRYTQVGTRVDLVVSDTFEHNVTGHRISRTAYAADPTSHMMRAEIDVANDENLFRPGMEISATIHWKRASSKGVHLPVSCLVEGWTGSAARVYVVRDGKASLREVRPEYFYDQQVELASGLTAADLVVNHPGRAKLKGQTVPVRIREKR